MIWEGEMLSYLLALIELTTDLGRPLGRFPLHNLLWLLESDPEHTKSTDDDGTCLGFYDFRGYRSSRLDSDIDMLAQAGYVDSGVYRITKQGRRWLRAHEREDKVHPFQEKIRPRLAKHLATSDLFKAVEERIDQGSYPPATPPSCVRF